MIWLDRIPESLRERTAADLQAGELVRYNEAELRTRGLFDAAIVWLGEEHVRVSEVPRERERPDVVEVSGRATRSHIDRRPNALT